MDIIGKIIQELPVKSGIGKTSGKEWKVASYVLETQEQYPRKVCFELFGEDRIKANPCKVDDVVTVSFDIESREFNGSWFTSIRAWRIQQGVVEAGAAAPAAVATPADSAAAPAPAPQPAVQAFDTVPGSDDTTDLPF